MSRAAQAKPQAPFLDAPPVTAGLVLFGSVVPTLTLLPVTAGVGVPSSFPSGRDVVAGFDDHGHRLFMRTFADAIYNYYVFVPLDAGKIRELHRLRVTIGARSVERTATRHGPAVARAQTVGAQRVRITWDARAFPRLSCRDEAGGSPAPLMLEGDFTAADVRGNTLRCDFSDGVRTVYAAVRVPIEATKSAR